MWNYVDEAVLSIKFSSSAERPFSVRVRGSWPLGIFSFMGLMPLNRINCLASDCYELVGSLWILAQFLG